VGAAVLCARSIELKKYMPMIKRVASRVISKLPSSVSLDDMIQVGMIALNDALNKFDSSQGIAFEAYALQRIKGSMMDDLRANDFASRSVRHLQKTVSKTKTTLEQQLGRMPSESEMSNYMGTSLEEYHDMLLSFQGAQLAYIEDLISKNEDEKSFLDYFVGTDETPLTNLIDKRMREALLVAMSELTEREQQLMKLYYLDDLNMREIASIMLITEGRVCQIHSQIVAKLRKKLKYH
jgi:RNA polymerase sigma factor for flagellar operon FliA